MAKKRARNVYPEFDRMVFDVAHALVGMSAKEVAEKAGISINTVYNIRKGPKFGGTRYPRGLTLQRMLQAAGRKFIIIDETSNSAQKYAFNAPNDVMPKEPDGRKKQKTASGKKLTKLEIVSKNGSPKVTVTPIKSKTKAKGTRPRLAAKVSPEVTGTASTVNKLMANSAMPIWPVNESAIPVRRAK